ncbi:MAG: hypothetical protein ABFS56_23115 [Pseudomonadota bacterium]
MSIQITIELPDTAFLHHTPNEFAQKMRLAAAEMAGEQSFLETVKNEKGDLVARLEEQKKINKQLEDLMAITTHKFRGYLQSIEYEDKKELINEDVHIMNGLLNMINLISVSEDRLRKKLSQDMQGEGNLLVVLEHTLSRSLASLLTIYEREKIRQHYLNYAKKTSLVPATTTRKQWKSDYLALERQIQADWQSRFAEILKKPTLESLTTWLGERFFPLEVQGFVEAPIHFEPYGATESMLRIIISELFVNAVKYYVSDTQQPVQLSLACDVHRCQLRCANPTRNKEQRICKGNGKGHHFLFLLAQQLKGNFPEPPFVEDYVAEFNMPADLLMEKNV